MTEQTENTQPYYLHSFSINGLQKVEHAAYTIGDAGQLVIVGGNNGEGKSSLLSAIAFCFAGKKQLTDTPILQGKAKGDAKVTLCDSDGTPVYEISRTIKVKGQPEYAVVDLATGEMLPDFQAWMNSLVGAGFAFNPVEFAKQGKDAKGQREQLETLKRLVGLDFTELEVERKKIYDARTEDGKEKKFAEENLQSIPKRHDLPPTPVDVSALQAQQREVNKTNEENAQQRRRLDAMQARNDSDMLRIKELRQQLAMLEEEYAVHHEAECALGVVVSKLQDTDTAPIDEKIRTASDTNAAILKQKDRVKYEAALADANKAWDEKTAKIADIDAEKKGRLDKVQYPVEGLDLNDLGVMYHGLPLSSASSAEQLMVSVGIGIALNPRLKIILLYEGGWLDSTNMKLIDKMAHDAGVTIFLECVGKDKKASFIMDEGNLLTEWTDDDGETVTKPAAGPDWNQPKLF
jgi:hypothetical protein